jgi:two-component system CheB/CheR fusion protein
MPISDGPARAAPLAERAMRDPGDLEQLLEYVQRARDFDFTGYKRPTLTRRIIKRMGEVGCETYGQYQDHLEVHPDELVSFFDSILVNVTSFFRDPEAWEFVAAEIVPRIVSGRQTDDPIRVWSAGCASGEEAYTLAIVLCEALGMEAFSRRVKVYGTDVDETALAQARQATYSEKALETVPDDLRERYFQRSERGYEFRGDLRRSVVFGRHDLLEDAPISRLDLLVCRNTLMYFDADAQAAILDRFRFALARGGYLLLGRAETLLTHSSAFRPLQLKLRIFERLPSPDDRRSGASQGTDGGGRELMRAKLRDAAFDAGDAATMVIDAAGLVQAVNGAGRSLFAMTSEHLGRPMHDLEISYRPLDLRALVDEACQRHDRVVRRGVSWPQPGDHARAYDVTVLPLHDRSSGSETGVSISFQDVTRGRVLEAELEQSTGELHTTYEHLRSANEELETMNEKLETMNEQLQSANGELQATNEELRSANEELETMNAELQSTNDDLHVVNETLATRGRELDRANSYLQSILTGIQSGVVVVDPDLVVQIWNPWMEEWWGLREVEAVGYPLVHLDIGVPVADIEPCVRAALAGVDVAPLELPARNRRGREFRCRVRTSPVVAGGVVVGALVVMDEKSAPA